MNKQVSISVSKVACKYDFHDGSLARKEHDEVSRRSNVLSYQGKYLDRRIKDQMLLIESFRRRERRAKGIWFSAQLNVING